MNPFRRIPTASFRTLLVTALVAAVLNAGWPQGAVAEPESSSLIPTLRLPVADDELPPGLNPDRPLPVEPAQPESVVVVDDDVEKSVFTTWWFWVLAAGIVAGTVALGIAASNDSPTPARGCMSGFTCFGDGR